MFEQAEDAAVSEQRRDRVKVAEVEDDHRIRCRNDHIVERTEDRGRAGVHQEEWFRPGPTAGHRLHARHSRGDLRAEKAEALQADATLDLVAQGVAAKPAVAHPW